MFYRSANSRHAIRQGDIFCDLPFVKFDPDRISTINPQGQINTNLSWEQVKNNTDDNLAGVKISAVTGIVISQDCDNLRNDFISFAKISPFTEVTGLSPQSDIKWTDLIKKGPVNARYHWFYLPKDENFHINERMAVDFDVIFQLPISSILSRRRNLRIASLGEDAIKHFRDTITKYFTRYAHNEWYSFTKEEFQAYKAKISQSDPEEAENIIPYPHQE